MRAYCPILQAGVGTVRSLAGRLAEAAMVMRWAAGLVQGRVRPERGGREICGRIQLPGLLRVRMRRGSGWVPVWWLV